jgi:hypothetical protein
LDCRSVGFCAHGIVSVDWFVSVKCPIMVQTMQAAPYTVILLARQASSCAKLRRQPRPHPHPHIPPLPHQHPRQIPPAYTRPATSTAAQRRNRPPPHDNTYSTPTLPDAVASSPAADCAGAGARATITPFLVPWSGDPLTSIGKRSMARMRSRGVKKKTGGNFPVRVGRLRHVA